jgi:hypothetical protein
MSVRFTRLRGPTARAKSTKIAARDSRLGGGFAGVDPA